MTSALEEQDKLYYLKFDLDLEPEKVKSQNENSQEVNSKVNKVVQEL